MEAASHSHIATISAFAHTRDMPAHFHGSLQELKDRLLPLDLDGDWEAQPNRVWKLRCKDRAGILWSETKGTVWFDGPAGAQKALSEKVEAILADGVIAAPMPAERQRLSEILAQSDQVVRTAKEQLAKIYREHPNLAPSQEDQLARSNSSAR
jgi:hypothetical protein